MVVRAVLFDAFGTLVHPEPGWRRLRDDCLAIVHGTWSGPRIPLPRFLDAYERARATQRATRAGDLRAPDFAERFAHAALACGAPAGQARAWGPVAAERYHRYQQALVHAYDRPAPVLDALRARGYRLGIVSNFAHGGVLREALARLDLLRRLDAVVVSSEVGLLKPHPRAFAVALDALGVAPHEAVMVGDDLACDVVGARRAGLRAVWIPYPRVSPAPRRPEADAVVERLADLPDVLPKLD